MSTFSNLTLHVHRFLEKLKLKFQKLFGYKNF
jgi:hypothetical protein